MATDGQIFEHALVVDGTGDDLRLHLVAGALELIARYSSDDYASMLASSTLERLRAPLRQARERAGASVR